MTKATKEDEDAMQHWPMNTMREQHGASLERLVSMGIIYGPQGDPVEDAVRETMSSESSFFHVRMPKRCCAAVCRSLLVIM